MENPRQLAFTKLKEPCVELSSVGLKFRGNQATSGDVLRALNPVYGVLSELAGRDALDEKLAEYAFFPLSHIFNETQRISSACLETAVNCLRILILDGWRENLSPQMGKQLIILLTLIVGGAPGALNTSHSAKSRPEELTIAGFRCLAATFDVLGGPVAEETVYHEIGTATIVDQTVYVLLEGIVDERSEDLCISAATALQALYHRVTDRIVLASIMPRTVSALTKTLKPTTQKRRTYRLLCICLEILTDLLRKVLKDQAVESTPDPSETKTEDDRVVLDGSWLKATASQIKIALANIIQIRRHERPEVQDALLSLCLMVIEDCQKSLEDSIPIVVDSMVVLAELEDGGTPNNAYSALTHTATTYPVVLDSLKNSLHVWITAFPRTMQGNDETAKQWALKQISTAYQILSQIQSGSDILTNSLAVGLCDSVAAAVNHAANSLQPLSTETMDSQSLEVLHHRSQSMEFPPVLMEHRSQQQTLKDLQSMVVRLNASETGGDITRLIINRLHHEAGSAMTAPFWLALTCLKSSTPLAAAFDDFISTDQLEPSGSFATRSSMIEELYYISLPILSEPLLDDTRDWRVSALALEAVALQAQQLGETFRPELMDALYPVLQLLASRNPNLQQHAMTCLNILTASCNYDSTSTMIVENVDYLVNSVALKLNTFDVSPYPPQVLFMMVKLCGGRLIPYLDDLVDSMFSILDLYHGYPKLVEMMFKTLAAIVDEGTKSPLLLAIENGKPNFHRKKQYQTMPISTLAGDLAKRKAKRSQYSEDLPEASDEKTSHPRRPWATESTETSKQPDDLDFDLENLPTDESDEPLPPPRDPEDQEKPLSKSHTLLLHIVKSIPSHLSSPSPYLRRSLLSIFIQVSPVFGEHENSFLPLINDVWPAVTARITLPASLTSTSSSSALIKPDQTQDPHGVDFQDELFVSTTACRAIEALCKSAGDFMATRVEKEFPRWERLYQRVWERVRHDAEKAIERRQAQQADADAVSVASLSALISSLSLATTAGGPPRTFTPHHDLWRALISLFITLLTHVRLPLAVGDQICEFVGAWIARYAGFEYYFSWASRRQSSSQEQGAELEAVDRALEAMETWNVDLTWFIFQQQSVRMDNATPRKVKRQGPVISEVVDEPLKTWSLLGDSRLKFANMVF
ncbi:armadillo-type protein [Aspergillus floccosus]